MQEDAACGMLGRMHEKLAGKFTEFRQAERKIAWLLDQWKWRWFAFRHRRQTHLNVDFDHTHGIETAMEVPLAVAVRNIASYHSAGRQCSVIESVHADALQYEFPDGPLVLFIFNALPREVMRELLLRLDNGIAADAQRPLFLIYTNLRTVGEVRGIFSGLAHFRIVRQLRNYIVIGNAAARARPA